MKNYHYFLMTAAIAFASCSSDEFVGDTAPTAPAETGEQMVFGTEMKSVTRAASGGSDGAKKLLYSFDILGTKTTGTGSSATTQSVFADAAYSASGLTGFKVDNSEYTTELYTIWYDGKTSTSNTAGWEYVEDEDFTTPGKYKADAEESTSESTIKLDADQSIKYWDYSADQYDFVAHKPTLGGEITAVTNSGYTYKGTPAQLAGLYTADKRVIKKTGGQAKYGEVVTLTFRNAATKVRVGFYETIPGYRITKMTFYTKEGAAAGVAQTENTAVLNGKFLGKSDLYNSSEAKEYPITFEDATADTSRVVIKASAESGVSEKTKSYNFGTLTLDQKDGDYENALSTTVSKPTYALLANGNVGSSYQLVTPNTDKDYVSDMVLYVDYVLTANDKSGETITVKGATATVPAAWMTWKSNYAYTYLFKISDKTNGTTGAVDPSDPTKPTDPLGLYPITFDAVVINTEDGTQETITTIEKHAVTTFAANSNVTEDQEYVFGEKIYVAISDGSTTKLDATEVSTDAALTAGQAAIYKLGNSASPIVAVDDANEGDVQNVINGIVNGLTLTAQTVADETYTNNTITYPVTTFTPSAKGRYAYVYCISAYNAGNCNPVATYTAVNASATFNAETVYYTLSDNNTYVKANISAFATGTTYYTRSAVADYSASTKYYIKQNEKYIIASGVTSQNYDNGLYYTAGTGENNTPKDGEYAVKIMTVN